MDAFISWLFSPPTSAKESITEYASAPVGTINVTTYAPALSKETLPIFFVTGVSAAFALYTLYFPTYLLLSVVASSDTKTDISTL